MSLPRARQSRSKGHRRFLPWAFLCAFVLACAEIATAQVRLPNVQVPPVQVPVGPGEVVGAAQGALNQRRLRDLREIRVRELLRQNRRELEADPSGAPALRSEIVAYDPSEASLRAAREAGFSIARESVLPGLDVRIVVLRGRPGASARSELRRLRRADRTGSYDYNHIYIESGMQTAETVPVGPETNGVKPQRRLALIDTGVDASHPSIRSSRIHTWGCGGSTVPAMHGTAVASLLIGDAPDFFGAAPRSILYAADVYCGNSVGGSVESIAQAFGWLVQEQVPVINVSLVGPPNALLEQVIRAVVARGHLVVAAVGNDGPSAKPLYPAAYDDVIGVTGVDTKRRVLVEALRGPQVDFAAPGVDMAAATLSNGYASVRGTSFAAPIIAGLLARDFDRPDREQARRSIETLNSEALDLGARGTDKVYGRGLVGERLRVSPAAVGMAETK